MLPRGLGRFFPLLGALTLVALLAFAACEGGGEEKPGVPELQDGTLDVGSDIAYAPIEFFQEGTEIPDGLDVDLANALAQKLGVEAKFQNTGFDGIIGALQAKRFDVIMSAMTVTDERKKETGFIPYFTAGTGILVPKGNPKKIQNFENLCGLKVAVQVGTIQADQVNSANDGVCASKKIDLSTFPKNPDAVQQLKIGRVDAELADFPVAAFDAKQSEGQLEVAPNQFEAAPYGIGLRKDSTGLNQKLTEALKAIRDDGTYDNILKKWGLEAGSLTAAP